MGSRLPFGHHACGQFSASVHTNNDVEGWCRRLNGKAAHGQLNLYLLLKLLGRASALVDVNLNLVKESQMVHQQRRSTRLASARLFCVRDRLVAGQCDVGQTLRARLCDLKLCVNVSDK